MVVQNPVRVDALTLSAIWKGYANTGTIPVKKTRYIILTAAILLLFSYFCTFVSLEMRHSVVIQTGIMGAVLLGYIGHSTILSALAATLYVVIGTRFYPESSEPLFSGSLTFIESFFFLAILAEAGFRIKPYADAHYEFATTIKRLISVSICCLIMCIYLTVVHIEIRIACIFVVGGLVSLILGTIEHDSAYSAFAVAAYVTLGCILAQSVSGLWTKPGELNSDIIVLFSASFFVSSLLIHASGVVKRIRAKQNRADSEQLYGVSNKTECHLNQCRIKYSLLIITIVLAAFLCGVFFFIESCYDQVGYIVILGGAGSVVLGLMKSAKFASALFIALYVAIGISISSDIISNFALKYTQYKIIKVFSESFLTSIIILYSISPVKTYCKNFSTTAVTNLNMMFCVLSVIIIILCMLTTIEIKIREIFFLVLCGIFAIAIGYVKCKKIAIPCILSVYITVGLLLPRYLSSRLGAKGEFDLEVVRIFLLAFCFSLFMVTVGDGLERLVANRKSVTRMSQL